MAYRRRSRGFGRRRGSAGRVRRRRVGSRRGSRMKLNRTPGRVGFRL